MGMGCAGATDGGGAIAGGAPIGGCGVIAGGACTSSGGWVAAGCTGVGWLPSGNRGGPSSRSVWADRLMPVNRLITVNDNRIGVFFIFMVIVLIGCFGLVTRSVGQYVWYHNNLRPCPNPGHGV